jgi:hypothetical protein
MLDVDGTVALWSQAMNATMRNSHSAGGGSGFLTLSDADGKPAAAGDGGATAAKVDTAGGPSIAAAAQHQSAAKRGNNKKKKNKKKKLPPTPLSPGLSDSAPALPVIAAGEGTAEMPASEAALIKGSSMAFALAARSEPDAEKQMVGEGTSSGPVVSL